jgi:FtsZ-binding cell division protein ZapB
MATSRQDPEVDSLGHLEERIQKAVALVIRLRQEKEAALKELSESQDANALLSLEIEELRSERQQVRGRIEKLLGHIDQLGSTT